MSHLLEEMTGLLEKGQLGHAYICVGDPLVEGKEFVERLASLVLAFEKPGTEEACLHRVQDRLHPDVTWVEPRGKLRQIKVEDMRKALKRIQEKSFEGGWKVIIFLGADRLNPNSGNTLLKNLEEPPERTLLLLVSQQPSNMLPTLFSRCQILRIPSGTRIQPAWGNDFEALMRKGPPMNLRARLERAAAFRDFFTAAAQQQMEADPIPEEDILEDDVENARETEARRTVQQGILAAVEQWYRDVMVLQEGGGSESLFFPESESELRDQAKTFPGHAIEKLIANTRTAAQKLEGNLPVQVVLEQVIF